MKSSRQRYISKSTFLMGLQCQKLLWFRYNAKDQIPAPDEATQAVFDQGTEVGEFARSLFPDGLIVAPGIIEPDKVIPETRKAIRQRRPLFEAAFVFHGGYARTDILVPVAGDAWDLIEVKSTTKLKAEVHLPDIAFQAFVLAGAGIKVRKCFLAHINNEFVRHGAIDPHQFFTLEDVTRQVSGLSREVEEQLDAMQRAIGLPAHPEIQIGPYCNKPYACPLKDRCWSFLPESNVLELYSGKKKGFSLLQRGVTRLQDIPDDFKLTDNQQLQKAIALSGRPHVDHPAITDFLERLEYPLHFLDFETFMPAIPLFDGQKPFQQMPFQFSLHIVRTPDAEPEHRMFLAEGCDDPRPKFMRQLREAVESQGSVVIFNASFELGRLKECAEFQPEHAAWVQQLKKRVVDLLVPFRKFHYYHPAQGGSASMKAVLPALTGKGYENLAIQEGGTASREFLRVTYGQVTDAERRRVRQHLEEYCGLDTEGMVHILRGLGKITAR